MAVFRELCVVSVTFLSSYSENAHPCTEPRRLTYYAWKSVQTSRLYAVGRTRKKRSRVNILMRNFAHTGKRNPLRDRDKILHVGKYPWFNHVCNFLWRSVKGFGGGKGSNFPFSHWLASSPLQHSRTIPCECVIIETDRMLVTSTCIQ